MTIRLFFAFIAGIAFLALVSPSYAQTNYTTDGNKIPLEDVHLAIGLKRGPVFPTTSNSTLVRAVLTAEMWGGITRSDSNLILSTMMGGPNKLEARIALDRAVGRSAISQANGQQILLKITTGGKDPPWPADAPPPSAKTRSDYVAELVAEQFAEVLANWDWISPALQHQLLEEMIRQRDEILRDWKEAEQNTPTLARSTECATSGKQAFALRTNFVY